MDSRAPRRRLRHNQHRAPQRRRRSRIRVAKRRIETPHAVEPRRKRNVTQRQRALFDQLLGKQQPPRLRHLHRRRSQMRLEQAPQMTRSHADALTQVFHRALVEITGINRAERTRHQCFAPGQRTQNRRPLGPAAQAGPQARCKRRSGAGEKTHIAPQRRTRRAHRPAKDAGGLHADKKAPVKARIARLVSAEQFIRAPRSDHLAKIATSVDRRLVCSACA